MTAVAVHDPSADVASLPLRFLAQAIDGLIYFGVVTLLIRATGNHSLELVADSGVPLFSLGWAMAYELEFLLLWSATPGKRLLGLYVSGANGTRVGALSAAIRVAVFHSLFVWFFVSEDIRSPNDELDIAVPDPGQRHDGAGGLAASRPSRPHRGHARVAG